jgi:NadR type nicotinamide-nucleotide adenylyltransferase
MSNGLVLGKFAPLHKGHQLCIERSIAENDNTYLMIYDCPEVTSIPLQERVSWIQHLYPHVKIIECWDGDNTVSTHPRVCRNHERYIKKMLNGVKIDNFYSSEFYGAHVSKALKAKDCRVDTARNAVPISGTQIRESPYLYRQYMDPVVYRSFIKVVMITGAPSTGKSTLCKALSKRYNTVWVPEYGRNYWARHNQNRRLTLDQLDTIAVTHLKLVERAVMKARNYLFVDTDAIVTRNFAKYYHGRSTHKLDVLADWTHKLYDLIALCADDIPYDDTEDRSGEANRKVFQKQIKSELKFRHIPYFNVWGSLDQRMNLVERELDVPRWRPQELLEPILSANENESGFR